VDYTFTDISPLFLERAAEQFDFYPSLQCKLLDIERDPVSQGFSHGDYDIVIAANVLHATADLRQTLAHVRSLLASGGLLFLLEGVAPERWVDLTFGMTPGWWRFTDTLLRRDYPLIDVRRWSELLKIEGFSDPVAVPGGEPASRAQSQQRLIIARASHRTRHWALIGDSDGVGVTLAGRLKARGDAVTVFDASATDTALPDCDEVVYLGALELSDAARDDTTMLGRAKIFACDLPLRWLGQVRKTDRAGRVWLVTSGVQSADHQRAGARWQAPLWGVGRVFALEQPDRWGGLIDLPPEDDADIFADLLLTSIDRADSEDQVVWRDGRRLVARLDRMPKPDRATFRVRPDATYLVTGGFGGLGLLIARWLAERGARHLALLGRNPDPDLPALRAIEAMGARIIPLAGDLSDENAMLDVFAFLAAHAAPLGGVIHAAAEFSAAPIGDITSAQIEATLRAKIDGTVVLEQLTRDMPLDFVVLFSSSTAVLGAAGLAHYAAANQFLDATAQTAVGAGTRVISVNWGTWEAMRLASQASQRSFREAGLEPMQAVQAFDALERLLASGDRQAMVARIDWRVLKPLHEARRPRPLLSRLETAHPRVSMRDNRKERAEAIPGLIDRLAKARPEARHDLIVDAVKAEIAAVLGLGASDTVSPEIGLFEMGMDSLMSVELKQRLERLVQRSLPSTLTFNYPNVVALAGFLSRELNGSEAAPVRMTPALPQDDSDLDDLDDAELEARLAARLETIQ
jgi:NAD(P)-dependent dehydrogenase (short-subunit alcohol dehydrogenase family)